MKQTVVGLLSAFVLSACSHAAFATTVNFDDAYAAQGSVATFYNSVGLTITGNTAGVIGGVGNGDPGNWGLGGTNGSAFLGCNQGSSCNTTYTFSTATNGASLDMGVRSGQSATITLSGYLSGALVNSVTLSITGSGANGGWSTFALANTVDKLVVAETGTFAYGADNLVFNATPASTPEPSSLVLLGTGALGLVGSVRRKWLSPRA